MMFKKILLLLPVLALSACAYTFDKQHQEVEIRTPGAQNAKCTVYANKVRYHFYPPEKRLLPKSEEDLKIDCWAPGNRHREVIIRPSIEKSTYANVLNGAIPGTTWDYASNAMFAYPDVVTVDFTGMPLVPSKLPPHNNSDIQSPEDYMLEEFRAGTPRLNEDRYKKEIPIRSRAAPGSDNDLYDDGYGYGPSTGSSEQSSYLEEDSGSYVQDMFIDNQQAIEESLGASSTDEDGIIVLDGNQTQFQEDVMIDNSPADDAPAELAPTQDSPENSSDPAGANVEEP